jgi:hypothetical protein
LEGINEDLEGLRSQSTAFETPLEAATRVDSQRRKGKMKLIVIASSA